MTLRISKFDSGQAWRLKVLGDFGRLLRPPRWLIPSALLMMVVSRVTGLVLPAATRFLVDNVVLKRQTHLLLPLILIVLSATIIQGLSSFGLTQLSSRATHGMIAQLKLRVQEHLAKLPVSYFDQNKTGALVSRVMNDAEGVRNLFGIGSLDFIGALLTSVISFLALLSLSPLITGVIFLLLVLFGSLLWRSLHAMRPLFLERSKINAEVTGRLTESLAGVRVVKGYRAEKREHAVFAAGIQQLLKSWFRTTSATSCLNLWSAVAVGVVGTGVMLIGARQILAGTLTLGGFFTYIVFLGYLTTPLFQIVSIGSAINEAIAGLGRTRELLQQMPEDQDPGRTTELKKITGRVEFQDVSFGYSPEKPVLCGISFVAYPDTVTALVGSSGAGKSTIASLIAAFHKADRGKILVDDVDLSTVCLDSYRRQLGLVLQDSFLFDGSIRENVAFSRPNASQDEILRACAAARVDEFAARLPHGYDSIIGERGVQLSGGQRQRISIARAILADPRVLILDEATSNLDCESEALIQEALAYLVRGRTTFLIAHRLSTIKAADQILVIDNGMIVERGTHQSLSRRGGRYYRLFTRQPALREDLVLGQSGMTGRPFAALNASHSPPTGASAGIRG